LISEYISTAEPSLFVDVLRRIMSRLTDEDLGDMLIDRNSIFINCFIAKRDDLYHWNCYGDNGHGYAIGFRSAAIGGFVPDVIPYGVIYGSRRHHRFSQSLLQRAVPAYARMLQENGYPLTPESVENCLYFALRYSIPFLKHAAFSLERETRCIVEGMMAPGTLKYHMKGSINVPHIPLKFTAGHLPIANIIVGPSNDFEKCRSELRKLLRDTGYTQMAGKPVRIVNSKVLYIP
jgi:hypothetical protein